MPIYPLNEVSTNQGRNMRETCARVLAAALMTGAIAGVVAMTALLGAPSEGGRPITAPPSSLERSVRTVALPAPRPQRASVRRPVYAHHISRPVRPSVLARRLVSIHTRALHTTRRRLASTKPKAAPVVPPVPVQEPVAEPAPPAPAPESEDDHGNGHAYGHEKDHGHGHEGHED